MKRALIELKVPLRPSHLYHAARTQSLEVITTILDSPSLFQNDVVNLNKYRMKELKENILDKQTFVNLGKAIISQHITKTPPLLEALRKRGKDVNKRVELNKTSKSKEMMKLLEAALQEPERPTKKRRV